METRTMRKVGGAAAMIGAVLAVVFNALHPRAGDIDDFEEELTLIADSGIWLFDHYMIAWALGFLLIAVVALGFSFPDEPARTWGRLSMFAGVGAVIVGFVSVTVDGAGMKAVADEWAAATDQATAAAMAEAVGQVSLALFTALQGALGFAAVLFGITGLLTAAYPRWLGGLALAAGVLALTSSSIQFFAGISQLTGNILFPIAALLFSVWAFAMGWHLWRGADQVAEVPT